MDDQLYQEIEAIFRKRKLLRLVKVLAILASLTAGFFTCLYTYAVFRIDQAKDLGVFPSAEEAAIGIYNRPIQDAQVESIDIVHCGPNNPGDESSRIWFCTAWVKYDRVPSGYNHSRMLNGSFFVRVREGWVYMPEQAFPGFIEDIMGLYHLEGYRDG